MAPRKTKTPKRYVRTRSFTTSAEIEKIIDAVINQPYEHLTKMTTSEFIRVAILDFWYYSPRSPLNAGNYVYKRVKKPKPLKDDPPKLSS